jgi:predicted acetyltransferase
VVDVRQTHLEELVAWSEAMALAHGGTGSDAVAIAAFRRERYRPSDAERLLGAYDRARVVGTYRSFATTLTLPGGTGLEVAAVTNVGVIATHRRQGILGRMMEADLRADRERGEAAAILIASEYPIYGRYGFGPATEQATWTIDRARGAFEVPAETGGHLEVVPTAEAATLLPVIFERHRVRQPGEIDRLAYWYEVDIGLASFPGRPAWNGWVVVHRAADGTPDGSLRYRIEDRWEGRLPASKLHVDELIAPDPAVEAALWRFALDVDLIVSVQAENRRIDEPVVWRLVDARAAAQTQRADFLWLRPLDLPRLLEERAYAGAGRVVIEAIDPAGFAAGRFTLDAGMDGSTCRPTRASAGLRMPVEALGSVLLGGGSLRRLAAAGRIDVLDERALDVADGLFRWPVEPWCTSWF